MIQTWINYRRAGGLRHVARRRAELRRAPAAVGDPRLATGAQVASETSRVAFASLMLVAS